MRSLRFSALAVLAELMLALCVAASPLSPISRAKALLECNVCKTSQLTGTVDDCCTDFSTVDEATRHFFLPVLTALQKKPFFKFFKVNLDRECPFWQEDGQCFLRDCSVCECDPKDIPLPWLEQDKAAAAQQAATGGSDRSAEAVAAVEAAATTEGTLDVVRDDSCQEQMRKERECKEHSETEKRLGKVNLSESSPNSGLFQEWSEPKGGDVWTVQDDDEEGMRYVNLDLNPEKFTGYSGASAQKVWRSIYSENCFGTDDHHCKEKRVFFRLLSGLQSSITTQIANDYRFDDGHWGPNVELFLKAVGAHPDRMTNLYFAYLFVLRAVAKAAPLLEQYDYSTGHALEDAATRELVRSLAHANVTGKGPKIAAQECLTGFDESGLFQPHSEPAEMLSGNYLSRSEPRDPEELRELQVQFMARFQNISRIMDCVGCEKCKLWGKLETLGLGTAIKIMLPSPDGIEIASLNRNEVIALVNTAAQLAKSVGSVPNWRWLEVRHYARQTTFKLCKGVGGSMLVALLVVALSSAFSRPKAPKEATDSKQSTPNWSNKAKTASSPAAAAPADGSAARGPKSETSRTKLQNSAQEGENGSSEEQPRRDNGANESSARKNGGGKVGMQLRSEATKRPAE